MRNAERLHGLLPAARILIAVRRQDEMLRSIHAQYVNEGGTRPLRAFIDGRGVAGSRFSLRHLEYDRLVGRYVDLFGRDRVWVVPYEYLRASPDRFLDRLCEMLGTRLTARVSHARLNHSLSRPALWLLRSWNRLFRALALQSGSAPCAVAGWPPRAQHHAAARRPDPAAHGVGDRRRRGRQNARPILSAEFARSNERLQHYCAEPLGEWGYALP